MVAGPQSPHSRRSTLSRCGRRRRQDPHAPRHVWAASLPLVTVGLCLGPVLRYAESWRANTTCSSLVDVRVQGTRARSTHRRIPRPSVGGTGCRPGDAGPAADRCRRGNGTHACEVQNEGPARAPCHGAADVASSCAPKRMKQTTPDLRENAIAHSSNAQLAPGHVAPTPMNMFCEG